jgi:hypothetical protein
MNILRCIALSSVLAIFLALSPAAAQISHQVVTGKELRS